MNANAILVNRGSSATQALELQNEYTQVQSVRDLDLSHDGQARRFGKQGFNQEAKYTSLLSEWKFWDGVVWKKDKTQNCRARIRAFVRAEAELLLKLATAEAQSMGYEGKELLNWARTKARQLKSMANIKAVEVIAQTNQGVPALPEDFDPDPLLLGTPSVTVDLRTGKMRPARRQDMISRQTNCSPADPSSVPTLWLSFLERIFNGDQEIIDFIQRAAGYALTGLNEEHKFLFLHGSGRNGKSVFLETLRFVMGDYATTASSNLLLASKYQKSTEGIAALRGARFVSASEIPKRATWDESLLKQLTGGEAVTARFLYQNNLTFVPELTLMIAGNEKPSLESVDPAMRARFVLVPFDVQIPEEERDPHLGAKLRAEAPKILSWMIRGALQWQAHSLAVPEVIRAASDAYLEEENIIQNFLDDETEVDATSNVPTQDLFSRYQEWCKNQGIQPQIKKTFKNDLIMLGFWETKRGTCRVFHGLRLRTSLP